ncbi:MAG: TetR/AcrR family transcriptional regulator [Polyangiaceae bacterium]
MSVSKRTYLAGPERRAQILDCALAAFADRGYHATSIADVCARASIGRATLYQYFDDKRDLLVSLANEICDRVIAAFEARKPIRIPRGLKPTEADVVAFSEERILSVLRVLFEDRNIARLVIRAGRGADGVVDQILQKIDEAVIHTIEAELTLARDAGLIRDIDPHFVARFFLGGFEKIVMAYLDDDRPIDVQAIAREAALLEVSGIYPRDSKTDPTPRPQPKKDPPS